MMRTLAAILALSPAMLFAQSSPLAQPVSTPRLVASLSSPAALPSGPSGAADAASAPVRISTGIVAPRRINAALDSMPDPVAYTGQPGERIILLNLTVGTDGRVKNVEVVKAADPLTNWYAVRNVKQYRYEPATLNGKPVAVEVHMAYHVEDAN